jgi:hypothetical protein
MAAVKVSVMLDGETAEYLDRTARAMGCNRSEAARSLIRGDDQEIVRLYMAGKDLGSIVLETRKAVSYVRQICRSLALGFGEDSEELAKLEARARVAEARMRTRTALLSQKQIDHDAKERRRREREREEEGP